MNGTSPLRAVPTTDSVVTVGVVNDFDLVVQGVSSLFAEFEDRVRVVTVEVGGIPDRPVDVILLDAAGNGHDLIERAREMRRRGLGRRILVYTWDTGPFVEISRENDVLAGVVSKTVSGSDLADAVLRASAGEAVLMLGSVDSSPRFGFSEPLSEREAQVARLIADGLSNAAIARSLNVSTDTVKTYVSRLFVKVGARNRAQVAACIARADNHLPETDWTRSG